MAVVFQDDGVEIVPDVLNSSECDTLTEAIAALASQDKHRSAGMRNLLRTCPAVAQVASSRKVLEIVHARLQREAFPVRVLFFDKTEAANWSVPWHQDLLIAVAEMMDVPGFGPWSVKAGVVHVQPPPEILELMLTVRLHLDDCDEANGALKVLPGSHAHGVLSDLEVNDWKGKDAIVCEVKRGGAVLMRPLVLHASSPAAQPRHRRVIHIEYAVGGLPGGLRWFERGR